MMINVAAIPHKIIGSIIKPPALIALNINSFLFLKLSP